MKKRLGFTIGFVLLGCVCLILMKNLFSYKIFKGSTYGMPALIELGQVDNLFIGSSMFRQGIDIQEMNIVFDDEVNYILAYNGNQPIWEYLQLRYLLDNGVKINSLYVDMYVYSAWEEPELNDEKMFLEFDYTNKKWIYDKLNQDNLIRDWWQLWVSSNNEMLFFWPVYTHLVNAQFYRGGTLSNIQGATFEQLEKQSVYEISGKMNAMQKEYLEKIIDLCHEKSIELAFVETPKYYKIQNDNEYKNAMQEYDEFLRNKEISAINLQKEFDSTEVIFFRDIIHLSSEGRKEFTKMLCTELKRNVEGK